LGRNFRSVKTVPNPSEKFRQNRIRPKIPSEIAVFLVVFPCPPSPSNLQSNLAGRLSFPSITSTSTYKALDPVKVAAWATTLVFSPVCLPAPVTLDKNTSHQPATQSMYATAPMPQPVTTIYDSLTTRKLP